MNHISTQLLEGYGQRRLDAAALLALDDHLLTCAECRERVRQLRAGTAALLALEASLLTAEEADPAHLPHEQLMAYVVGRLDEVDRELTESHLEVCPQCTAQTQELSIQLAKQPEAVGASSGLANLKPSPARLWDRLLVGLGLSSLKDRLPALPLRLQVAGAVAVLALSLIAVGLWVRTQQNGQEIAGYRTTSSPAPAQSPISPSPTPPPAISAPVLLALNDGDGQITLDAQGNVGGMESLSPSDRQRIKDALEQKEVRVPKRLKELSDSSGSIMGSSSEIRLVLLSPIGKIVESDRPVFRWRPLSGATSYQVTITDPAAGYREVAASPQLPGTTWTVDRPLERGRVYTWQVTAHTGGGEVKAPGPNAPEAKFKMLEQSTAGELARAKKSYAGSHLALGLLYAEAGLLDEAERELKALTSANPQSPEAQGLLQDIQSKRRK